MCGANLTHSPLDNSCRNHPGGSVPSAPPNRTSPSHRRHHSRCVTTSCCVGIPSPLLCSLRCTPNLTGTISAAQLRQAEQQAVKITTFCAALDAILGGGIHPGQITEFCTCRSVCYVSMISIMGIHTHTHTGGVPAVGKTQLGYGTPPCPPSFHNIPPCSIQHPTSPSQDTTGH